MIGRFILKIDHFFPSNLYITNKFHVYYTVDHLENWIHYWTVRFLPIWKNDNNISFIVCDLTIQDEIHQTVACMFLWRKSRIKSKWANKDIKKEFMFKMVQSQQ